MILRCANCGAQIMDDNFLRKAPCAKCGSLARTIHVKPLRAPSPKPAPQIASWNAVATMVMTIIVVGLIAFVVWQLLSR
jgi:hypothetical protein